MSSFLPGPPDPNAPTSHEEPRLLTRRDELPTSEPAPSPARPSLSDRIAAFRTQRIQANATAHSTRGPKKFRGKTILSVIAVLIVVAIAALFFGGVWLRHSMNAALPQIDGTINTAGLSAPVTVTRDDHGVPSIQAANLDDLLFAQGFTTAQDRLWQMDALRRHAAGELAEILGSKLVAHDTTQRTLQIRAAADRAIAVLPADQLHQLDAYARGVNAFITQNADHLPLEFHILHYTPAPWTPRDSLLVALAMAQDLSTEFPTKLLREGFSAHLAPELLSDLYPVGSWRDRPPAHMVPDMTSPRPEIEQIPLDESQSKLNLPTASPKDLLAARTALSLETCDGCRSGSNNWAVAGSRTATGQPLVSNDMHLALGVPGIWYEASLHTTDGTLDVAGLTLPGTPFVIVGRNAHVAWGFTNLGGDVQDVYIEHLRKTGDTIEYQRADTTWAPVEHHAEHIRVRGGSDVTLDVITTSHNVGTTQIATPIISPLYPSEHRTLSLAWTVYDPANVTSGFLAANTATTGASLAAAFTNFGAPSLNLVYADDQNHIGYQAIGRIPVRGLPLHHPVVIETPAIPGEAPPNEDDTEALASPNPELLSSPQIRVPHVRTFGRGIPALPKLLEAAYRPRRRSSPSAERRALPKRQPTEQPKPKIEEAPIPAAPAPLGYTIGASIPAVPVDALSLDAQWSGYIPYAELPAVTDPLSGFLATANARITPNDYPYAIALDWASPYRVERITSLLKNNTGLVPADMLRIQMDIHSELDLALAHRIAYAIDHSANPTKRARQAADILRRWNGDVDVNAAAPAIVAALRTELWPMILVPQIAAHDRNAGAPTKDTTPEAIAHLYAWGEQGYVLEQLVLHTPKRWLPPGFANWNDLLDAAMERGLTNIHAPGDLTKWSYSKTHPVEINHPLLSAYPIMSRLLGVKLGSGPRIIGGDTSTIKATSHSFGPSERFTADLSNPAATTSNITTGQSGNPASQYYLDQLPHWLDGTTLPLPLHEAHATHTLTLHP